MCQLTLLEGVEDTMMQHLLRGAQWSVTGVTLGSATSISRL